MKYFLTIIFMAIVACGYGQTIQLGTDTVKWTVNEAYAAPQDSSFSYSGEFVTFGGSSIKWIQNNGSYTMDFQILSVSGVWNNPEQQGSNDYHVQIGNKMGTIRIEKKPLRTEIKLDFPENGQNSMPFSFYVTHVQKQ